MCFYACRCVAIRWKAMEGRWPGAVAPTFALLSDVISDSIIEHV